MLISSRSSAFYLFFKFPLREQRLGCKGGPDGLDLEPVVLSVLGQKACYSRVCGCGGDADGGGEGCGMLM